MQRLIKTIIYRASSTVLKQVVSWVLFQQLIINIALFTVDVVVGSIWYYGYETLFDWVKKKWMKK